MRPRLATGLPLRCGSSGPRNEARDNCQQPPTLCSLREQNTGYSTIVIRSNELPYGNEGARDAAALLFAGPHEQQSID